jgi:hypothetical protein
MKVEIGDHFYKPEQQKLTPNYQKLGVRHKTNSPQSPLKKATLMTP